MPIMLTLYNNRHYYSFMTYMSFMSLDELQAVFGKQLQELRISKNLDQVTTAEKAGISARALRNLEAGRGSSVETLIRVLKALDSLDGLQLLAPRATVSPLALLRHSGAVRRRVRRSNKEANQE